MDFENYLIKGVYCSQYIASWITKGGKIYGNKRKDEQFINWLHKLVINGQKLSSEDAYYIWKFGCRGKLELEVNAEEFLKEGV